MSEGTDFTTQCPAPASVGHSHTTMSAQVGFKCVGFGPGRVGGGGVTTGREVCVGYYGEYLSVTIGKGNNAYQGPK